MTEAREVAQRILAIFQEFPDRPILGSHLGLQIKRYFPQFDPLTYGCRNTRHFLQSYVSEVAEIGRRGQDVEYSLQRTGSLFEEPRPRVLFHTPTPEGRPNEITPPPMPIRHDLWKTFVTPNGPYRMYVNPKESTFQVLTQRENPPSGPWVSIPPCPADVHMTIAKDFASCVSDVEKRHQLEAVVGSNSWWFRFLQVARDNGLDKEWITFRRRRLVEEFERAISSFGVPLSAAVGLTFSSFGRPSKTFPGRTVEVSHEKLRRVVVRVVGLLSRDELNRIWLPAGLVVEATQNE